MRQIIAAAALSVMAGASTAQVAGYSPISIDARHHGKEVLGALWYPSDGSGRSFKMAENPVFHGVTVVEESQVLEGSHPVVLLSHGMGGNIRSLAWLASGLAERGAIVVSVNHPNSTWGDFDLGASMQHWTRVQDLSRALDVVLADADLAAHIDQDRIMAAGFSFGGWTALSMGGITGNHAGFRAHCLEYGGASSHCDKVLAATGDLGAIPEADWNASYRDDRISSVFAIDPGIVWGLEAQNLGGLIDKVSMVSLGAGEDRLLATDFDASGLAALMGDSQIDRIAPANHFSAMPLCKPLGAAILEEENDDPVCTDPNGSDRGEVHQMILDRMAADLGL